MKRLPHFLTAFFLIMIYTGVIMGPISPLACKSPWLIHALTGECVGDCAVCGCSAERRANHTCCCWRKKLKHAHERGNVADCCKKKQRHRAPMLSCNCPCGGDKHLGISGPENSEHLLSRHSKGEIALANYAQFSPKVNRLTDRHGDPPDPPPKIAAHR